MKEKRSDAFELLAKLPLEAKGQAISGAYFTHHTELSEADIANLTTISEHWPAELYQAVRDGYQEMTVGVPIPQRPLEDAAFSSLAKGDDRFHDQWLVNYALASGDVATMLRVGARLRNMGNLKWTQLMGEAAMMVQ